MPNDPTGQRRDADEQTTGLSRSDNNRSVDEPSPGGLPAASKFLGRIAQLDDEALRICVASWHDTMRVESDAWFGAERSTANAVHIAGKVAEQETLIGHLSDFFLRRVWYRAPRGRAPTPERRVGATEASGQYIATVAMLALLVRSHLDPPEFDVLYSPFSTTIPLRDLGRE